MSSIKITECKCVSCKHSLIVYGHHFKLAQCLAVNTESRPGMDLAMVEVDNQPWTFLPDVIECNRFESKI